MNSIENDLQALDSLAGELKLLKRVEELNEVISTVEINIVGAGSNGKNVSLTLSKGEELVRVCLEAVTEATGEQVKSLRRRIACEEPDTTPDKLHSLKASEGRIRG